MHRAFIVAVIILTAISSGTAGAQSRVGKDSATRTIRFGRDVLYGTAEGLGFAVLDQVTHSPGEWGNGWPGYRKRAASNVGEFLIQESVTEGLAAAMNRPLDYRRCKCRGTAERVGWAVKAAVVDDAADGTHPLAVPRIVGAYTGSFAQSLWRPDRSSGRLRVGLVNGTTSLAIGALINLYHEFR
jgi:hypothetical protein